MFERQGLPRRKVGDPRGEEAHILAEILGFALASDDSEDRCLGPHGHARKENGARVGRHNDPTGYLRIEIAPPALHEG